MMRLISTLDHGEFPDNITFSENDVFHRFDVFNQQYLDRLFEKGKPKYFISDHFTSGNFNSMDFFGLPLFIERELELIVKASVLTNEIISSTCFNFIINKKQINRFLCIKLIELFELKDFNYTWSGIGREFDLSYIIDEFKKIPDTSPIDQRVRGFLLSPIKIEKNFFEYFGNIETNSSIIKYGGNIWTWNNGLQKIFSESAISLITESVAEQQASVFTEKTLYAVLGLTFPIWIGGYNQAKEWSRLGFDTFDDIIDHSYQDKSTLIERCYYAIANNIDLISNKDKIFRLRAENKDRLLKNRDFLLQGGLTKFIDQEITKLPMDLQQVMPEILKRFRNEKTINNTKVLESCKNAHAAF